jgi:hypothetical protein
LELKRGDKPGISQLGKPHMRKIRRTVEAMERYVNPAGITLGLLRYLALSWAPEVLENHPASRLPAQSNQVNCGDKRPKPRRH